MSESFAGRQGTVRDRPSALGVLDESLRLEAISPTIYRVNLARRFARASVLWLNDRWFRTLGVDLDQPTQRQQVERWLLDNYAVGIPSQHDPDSEYVGPAIEMNADRYGGTGGTVHGGSGRCLFKAGFNVKGAGRTNLTAGDTDWYHSHGCLWLEEAIRETLFGELAAQVFPKGAVPVIALLDTGTRIFWDDGTTGERRALLVRPNFVRIAHLQRSLFFGTSGFLGSDQELDARRCREVAERLWAGRGAFDWLHGLAQLIGEQVGFARFHRLWPGPFFSSNFSVDGRLLDFGSFRSLPDWKRRQGAASDLPFGREDEGVAPTLHNLAFLGSRIDAAAPNGSDLCATYRAAADEAFRNALFRLCRLPDSNTPAARKLHSLVRDSFASEQAGSLTAGPWRLRDDVQQRQVRLDPDVRALLRLAEGSGDDGLDRFRACFADRPSISREAVQIRVEAFVRDELSFTAHPPEATAAFVQSVLSEWRNILKPIIPSAPLSGYPDGVPGSRDRGTLHRKVPRHQ